LTAATLGLRAAAGLAAYVDQLALLVHVIDLDGEGLADAQPAADQKLGQGRRARRYSGHRALSVRRGCLSVLGVESLAFL
jgi:hypothetical protein